MSTDPFEHSRAAVAVSCLEWLRCTGPAVAPARVRVPDRAVGDHLREGPPVRVGQDAGLDSPAHPLGDRWLDG